MLPENVMLDVLTRLPVKTIVCCKCVCKKWRGLVADPYFVDLHLSRSREEALMILDCPDARFSYFIPATLKWVEIEHEHLDTVKSLNLKPCQPTAGSRFFRFGSVNGLVSYLGASNDFIHIFNPVLEEYMSLRPPRSISGSRQTPYSLNLVAHTLPPTPRPPQGGLMLTLGYGFGVSTAGEYKVIWIYRGRVFINPSETAVWVIEIEVHTLGTDHWRSLRQTPLNSLNLRGLEGPAVYLNCHLYWLTDDQIYDFDLSSETAELFPYPPSSELFPYPPAARGYNQESHRMLGVLKGRLSCICWCSSGGVEVWVMKEESTNWYKEITVIQPVIQLGKWRHQRLCLVAYCLNTNKILSGTPNLSSSFSSVMTYRPSFVKLENFGSERVHSIPCTTTTHMG